jgi:hypothetical protein
LALYFLGFIIDSFYFWIAKVINYLQHVIEFSAEEAKRVYGDIIPSPLADRRLFVLKQVILFIFLMF